MFNMAVGDYIQGYVMTPLAGNVDARSSILVMPVGGTKGDKGDPGIAGNLASANYWWSSFSGPGTISPSTKVQLTPAAPVLAQGFHIHANGSVAVCDVAGLYRIGVHLTFIANAVSQYTDTYIEIHDPNTFTTILASSNPVGMGIWNGGQYYTSDGELVAYLRVGDYISIFAATDAAKAFQTTRSYWSITPVGGAKGDPGTPGTSVGTTAWTTLPFQAGWGNFGTYQLCQYRLEGDRVFLRGLATQTVLANLNIATLPTGFWPKAQELMFTMGFGNTAKDHIQRIEISPAGSLAILQPAINELQAYVTLTGLSWSITA
jgi:hypothetical protein